MRNSLCVVGLRLIMKIRNIFVDVFMTLYLWSLSDGSVPTLCRYYMVFILCIYLTMSITGPLFSKRRSRKILLVIGCILQVIFLVLVYKFGNYCIDHVVLLAMVNGFADGSYYCIYNLFEAEGISGRSRHSIFGIYESLSAATSVVFPIIAGVVIYRYSMNIGVLVVLTLMLISVLVAIMYRDNGDSVGKKFSYHKLFTELKKSGDGVCKLKYAVVNDLCRGMINSFGSFTLFISVWTMIAFSDASEVGAISGISYGFKALFGLVFAKWGSKIHKKNMFVYIALRIALVASLISMGITGSFVGLMIMTLTLKCSDAIESPVCGCGLNTILNTSELSNYKPEFLILLETALTVSRIFGYGLLWLWGFYNNGVMLSICITVYSVILLITPFIQDRLYKLAYPNSTK